MAFNENPYSSLVNDPVSETSPMLRHQERRSQVPSSVEIIPMTSNSIPSVYPIRSSKKKRLLGDGFKSADASNQIEISPKNMAIVNLGHRLHIRKDLNSQRTIVSDIMCFFGILGIILMIIENELNFRQPNDRNTKASWFIKLIISFTTAILLVLVCYYHLLDLKFYANQNCIANWTVGLTKTKLCLIIVELLICAIHPMPRGPIPLDITQENSNFTTSTTTIATTVATSVLSNEILSRIRVDVALGLPMFCRLYLIARSIMFHSSLVRNASTRSVGYLNQVPINFFFLTKTYLEQWPIFCMVACFIVVLLIGSWCMRACELLMKIQQVGWGAHIPMYDAMWLFVITFTTVGYGDLSPHTYCGRCIAALIGLFGILVTSLTIAIVTQKLQLSREEKYVHTFALNTGLAKHRVTQAANVVKFAIKVWYVKSSDKRSNYQIFKAQQKLYRSIHLFKKIREDQAGLIDNCMGTVELMTVERKINDRSMETGNQIMEMKVDINKIKEKLNDMNQSMNILQDIMTAETNRTEEKLNNMARNMETLQKTINVLLDKVTK